jgi:ribosome-associated toxin RatA of RatAB toxin-antitoxin module
MLMGWEGGARSFYQRRAPAAGCKSVAEVVRSVLVGNSCEEMYALVDAVEEYPKFLPWCGGTQVLHRDAAVTRATVLIDYHGIRQSFTTENAKREPQEMQIRLVEGPFRVLDGTWRFTALGERACKVELRLRYEFSSRILDRLVGPVFNHIANTLVDAFANRAEKIYGRRK